MIDRPPEKNPTDDIIRHMETEWYAVLKDPLIPTIITVQCRICPFSIRLNDEDHDQLVKATAAFIAHAKKMHSKTILRDKSVSTEKL